MVLVDEVKRSTIVGGTQVSNATKYAMTRYVDTIDHTQGHSLKMTKTHAPLHMDYNLTILGLITIHTWAHANQTILRMLRNHLEICSNRRTLPTISFASNYRRRWS
jgi:hypothetical protein